MSDHRDALEKIMLACETSSQYTRRLQNIHHMAMVALGMTFNQRTERHAKAMMYCGSVQAMRKAEGWKKTREVFGDERMQKII